VCLQCAESGHQARRCPASFCYNCEEPGHDARDCRAPRRGLNAVCFRCNMPGHDQYVSTGAWVVDFYFVFNNMVSQPNQPSWVQLYKPLGSTVQTSGFNCTNLWVLLYKPLGSTVQTSGFYCTSLWVQLYKPLGSTVQASGFNCTNLWVQLYKPLGLIVQTSWFNCTNFASICFLTHVKYVRYPRHLKTRPSAMSRIFLHMGQGFPHQLPVLENVILHPLCKTSRVR